MKATSKEASVPRQIGSLRRSVRAAALLCVLLLAFLRWHTILLEPSVKSDEAVYVQAAARLDAFESPYADWRFFYPPTFALLARAGMERLGTIPFLQGLRILCLLGAVVAVWLSLVWTGWPLWLRAPLAAAVVTLCEPIRVGLVLGNISPGIAGLVILALFLWTHKPLTAGLFLGIGLALKPLGLLLPLLLFAYRGPAQRRARRTAVAAVLAAGLFLLPGVWLLPAYLTHGVNLSMHPRNLSLARVLFCFGLRPPALVLLAVVGLLAIAWLRRRPPSADVLAATDEARGFALRALAVTLLAMPIVWIYTLVLALPIQAMGAAWIARRIRERSAPSLQLLLAALAILALLLAHGSGAVESWPLWLQGLLIAVPVASPLVLVLLLEPRFSS